MNIQNFLDSDRSSTSSPLPLKATSNYRLIYFAMYYDKQDHIFYAGDHFLAWQVLF